MPILNSKKILQEMEAAILSGEFKPRERLIEMELIAQYEVSRTIIREALSKLEAKGLVRIAPHRGARVADISIKEIEEIYFVRTEVEKIAARLVVKNIQAEEILGLKKLEREVATHLQRKTVKMTEKDGEFHRGIYRTCRNEHLCEIIDQLKTKAFIVAYNAWSMPQRIEESIREHHEIIQAIEARDAAKLEKCVAMHLIHSKKSYLDQLRGSDRWTINPKERKVD